MPEIKDDRISELVHFICVLLDDAKLRSYNGKFIDNWKFSFKKMKK